MLKGLKSLFIIEEDEASKSISQKGPFAKSSSKSKPALHQSRTNKIRIGQWPKREK